MYTAYKGYLFIVIVFIYLLIPIALFSEDCINCHSQVKKGKNIHPPAEECNTCHESINKHPSKGIKGFKLLKEGSSLCYECHDKKDKLKNIHPPVAGGECVLCHNPHSSDYDKFLIKNPPDLCYTCHESKIKEEYKHPPVEAGECLSCHNPHESDNERLLKKKDICYECHDRKDKKKFTHAPVAGGECPSCHNPHSSKNKSLLLKKDNDLCLNCHSDKEEALKKETVHPPAGEDCKNCHNPHGTDFAYQLNNKMNDLCFSCHDKEGFKLHVLSGVMGRSGGHPLEGKKDPSNPERDMSCISCHNPHGTDTPKLWNFGAKSKFELCRGCHQDK